MSALPSQARERPVLFNGDMVRAILNGTKTQTRRVFKINWKPDRANGVGAETCGFATRWPNGHIHTWNENEVGEYEKDLLPEIAFRQGFVACPFGKIGEKLWVRETIRLGPPQEDGLDSGIYAADGEFTALDRWCWKRDILPSIHCPRGLSRITLEITNVRVERLKEISEEDAKAEGVIGCERQNSYPRGCEGQPQRAEFAILWDSIYLDRGFGWASSPWVWVIEFRRVS